MQMTPAEVLTLAITGIGTITVPISLFLWSNRNTVRKELNDKHEENTKKFNRLLYDRENYRPHVHGKPKEPNDPLTYEGIHFAPRNGDDDH